MTSNNSSGLKNESNNFINTFYGEIVRGNIIKDQQLTSRLLVSIIFIGIFTHLFLKGQRSSYGTHGAASALIWGYSMVVFSIICILFINNINSQTKNIMKIIPLDVLLILIIMIWLISINSKYLTEINKGNVPNKFYSYSSITSIIILFQILFFLMTYVLKNNTDTKVKEILKSVSIINYILISLTFMFVLAQQYMLGNFCVDVL
tara:strand:- start:262 stop:876 length:615 start_codon:yes stop_codon:yes gene_type:complete